jgi:hypothetical protein
LRSNRANFQIIDHPARKCFRAGQKQFSSSQLPLIMTFNTHRRLIALDVLRQLGVQTEGFGDPMEYEESVAPWNQRVALKTP